MKNDTQMAVNILKYTGHLECEILQNKLWEQPHTFKL
jgi:hypothetical protein